MKHANLVKIIETYIFMFLIVDASFQIELVSLKTDFVTIDFILGVCFNDMKNDNIAVYQIFNIYDIH